MDSKEPCVRHGDMGGVGEGVVDEKGSEGEGGDGADEDGINIERG